MRKVAIKRASFGQCWESARPTRLLAAARDQDAVVGQVDEFGHRYVIDFPLEHAGRRALVRAAWIVLTNEDFPRLTSCYILRGI
jgi:hypothetical protein